MRSKSSAGARAGSVARHHRIAAAAVVIGAGALFLETGDACLVPPKELRVHHAEFVRRAPRIALAEFEKVSRSWLAGCSGDERYTMHFKTVEVLKGDVGPRFVLQFSGPHSAAQLRDRPNADYDGHRWWEVWEELLTRNGNDADCTMRPSFEIGAKYLIFLDRPYHWRAFERIDRADDRWLAAVRALVANPSRRSGLMQPLASYLAEQRAVFVGRVTRCYAREALYRHEVNVLDVLAGSPPPLVLASNRGLRKCESGMLVVGVVHPAGMYHPTPGQPPARVVPLLDGDQKPATQLDDALQANFNAAESEAMITDDAVVTVSRLRALAAPQAKREPQ